MALKTILCTKKYLTSHSLKIPIVILQQWASSYKKLWKRVTCLLRQIDMDIIVKGHMPCEQTAMQAIIFSQFSGEL